MRFKGILLSSIVLVIGLVIVSSSVAGACGPVDFDASAETIWCDARARIPTPPPPPTPTPVLVAAVRPVAATIQRGGDSPANALEVGSDIQNIPAGGRLWYKIGSNGNHIDVWIETYGQSGLGFAIYAPNQTDIQSPDTRPKGLGTVPNSEPNMLRWAGGSFLQIGTWYALVTNSSATSLSYRIGAVQSAVEKSCSSPYWEILPTGQGTFWVLCK
jgi:hypothetical protein